MSERKGYSLMVARFPGNNQEHPRSSGYLIDLQEKLLTDDRISAIVPFCKSDTPITMVRNEACRRALDMGVDYILMVDSDMEPDCEPGAPPFWDVAWDFMMARREAEEASHLSAKKKFAKFPPATIAAPYCGPPPRELVYVFKWAQDSTGEANLEFSPQMYDRDHAAMLSGISEVAALPTGLILYDARVFRYLPRPWFKYEFTDEYETRKATTEDVFQTRNASLMGMPQFCAWDCWAGHIKLKTVRKPAPLLVGTLRREFAEGVVRAARWEAEAE